MFKMILAAVDGSENSFRALDTAANLAKAFGGSLNLLSVYRHHSALENTHSLVRPKGNLPDPDEAMHDYTREIVEQASAYVKKEHGFEPVGYVRRGPPARTIVAASKELGCDAIVMGSRGLGDVTGLLLGSVSHKVASMAECTLVTVK